MKTSPDPVSSHDDEHPDLSALNARSGMALFAVYATIYLVFVVLSAFSPETMGRPTPLGPNVAVLYGFGLIAGALALALVYMLLCKRNADRVRENSK
jgi:uncharacterized membrane protein (DUF485 family)